MLEIDTRSLQDELTRSISGDVRFDRLSRVLYATDASIYEIVPVGVVIPRHADDVSAAVQACRRHNVPIIPRGAATGLTGGAVGHGLQLDFSRYLDQIIEIDADARTARVQPGVVLDELNARLAPLGLHFAPDVATSSRATIGGMIANNSCGAHSILYGRTVDHVRELTTVLADGSIAVWNTKGLVPAGAPAWNDGSARRGEAELRRVRDTHRDEIKARFPQVLRSNGGYGLDRLLAAQPDLNPIAVLSGSEGTLCLITEAVLNLTPLPPGKSLLAVHFHELMEALNSVPAILEHQPAAVELVDKMILDAARANPAMAARSGFIQGDPKAMLIVEFFGDGSDGLGARMAKLTDALSTARIGYAHVPVTEPARQLDVWEVRKAGLGLLMSRPGDNQPYAFIEDAAVGPGRLHDYIQKLNVLLRREGIEEVGHYAHASVGCLHVRPVLNLKKAGDVERMRRIADGVSSLVLEFGGTMTGEHGDGIVRSAWLEKIYGPKILQAFREIKNAFDPDGLLNPGKIVDPLPMTENLRFGPAFEATPVKTHYDFSEHGGMAGLAGMCSGVGQCRQRLVGSMCPSYRATGEEKDTTRARANALRVALSNRELIDGLDDPVLEEVLDLCLSCKACQTECPTGVDMAKLKAEWLAHRNRTVGVPRRSRLIADSARLAVWGSRFVPVSNWVMQSKLTRVWLEKRYGLDRRIAPPKFVRRTFRRWYRKHRQTVDPQRATRGRVVYYCDTWTNHHMPQVGIALFRLLEAAGFHVVAPEVGCCGRPLISKGLLGEATDQAKANIEALLPHADLNTPIIGTEPSCVSTLVDDYPKLVRGGDARRVASRVSTAERFLADLLRREPDALRFSDKKLRLLYHGHCHQKALFGTRDAIALLQAPPGYEASEIPSGCCGMAGSFGHEVEHYDVARAVGEDVLFPAVRNRGDAEVAVSGFSCRHQIEHHTGTHVRHLLEYLANAVDVDGP